jgi:hypothetical protein
MTAGMVDVTNPTPPGVTTLRVGNLALCACGAAYFVVFCVGPRGSHLLHAAVVAQQLESAW